MSSPGLVQNATDALQAQERLQWKLECQTGFSGDVKATAHSCLEALRQQKAYLEGSSTECDFPQVQEDKAIELKMLTLMHVPSSVTADVQKKFKTLVEQFLKDQCKSIVSITLLTCPWYELSQKERGEQAKHNILLVIFVSHDAQFFAPVNSHIEQKTCVIDLGWFCATELSNFGQSLCRGRTRYLEALFCRDGAQVYASQEWLDLRLALSYVTITGTRGFLQACLGQAVGGVGKKSKTGGMQIKEDTTIFEICESFRLLQHVYNTLRLKAHHAEVTEERLPDVAVTIMAKVKSFYHHQEPLKCKIELFDLLMVWLNELKLDFQAANSTSVISNQKEAELAIGNWLLNTRLLGRKIRPYPAVPDGHSRLLDLMKLVGGHVGSLKPEQVLLVAVAGSAMYNLSTPSSDVDYLVIYATPTDTLMSATKRIQDIHENRGSEKAVEYGAYEARTFCEMLLKCSVVILELLFAEEHEYMSPLWQELASHKREFVTEKAISQYLGLIKNNLKAIERGKYRQSPKKERKLFYQNFHKIHCAQHMIRGEVPPVKVSGQFRDFVMNVRTQEQSAWSQKKGIEELMTRYRELRESLVARTHRLRENPDYECCASWLMAVRGL